MHSKTRGFSWAGWHIEGCFLNTDNGNMDRLSEDKRRLVSQCKCCVHVFVPCGCLLIRREALSQDEGRRRSWSRRPKLQINLVTLTRPRNIHTDTQTRCGFKSVWLGHTGDAVIGPQLQQLQQTHMGAAAAGACKRSNIQPK